MSVPDRWLEYTIMNEVVPGTRFLPFKTPFLRSVQKRGNQTETFKPQTAMEMVGNLGYIISLVKTNRYYERSIFENNGIGVYRLQLQGNAKVPQKTDIDDVFSAIDNFVESNKDDQTKLIGVHCTHGVNRTGYIICRYMIQRLGIEPRTAVDLFEKARGHEFDHREYIEDLLTLTTSEDTNSKVWHSHEVTIIPGVSKSSKGQWDDFQITTSQTEDRSRSNERRKYSRKERKEYGALLGASKRLLKEKDYYSDFLGPRQPYHEWLKEY